MRIRKHSVLSQQKQNLDFAAPAEGGLQARGRERCQMSGGEESHDSYFPTFDDSLSVSHGREHLKPGQIGGAASPLSLRRETEVVIKSE